ncbi:hypothetical protein PMAYCL1PPCAC_05566, partial [Pristionchus mayeri]
FPCFNFNPIHGKMKRQHRDYLCCNKNCAECSHCHYRRTEENERSCDTSIKSSSRKCVGCSTW